MTPTLTILKNNQKLAALDVAKMEQTLKFAKGDTDLFFFRLAVIAQKHPEITKKNQASSFLIKQINLQKILHGLVARLSYLKYEWNTVSKSQLNRKEIIQQTYQLNQEIGIFKEIHSNVRRSYIRFANKHFQTGWRHSFLVA